MSSLRRKIRRSTAIVTTSGMVYTSHGTKGGSKNVMRGGNKKYPAGSLQRNFKGYSELSDSVAANTICEKITLPLTKAYTQSGTVVHIQHPKWDKAYKGA